MNPWYESFPVLTLVSACMSTSTALGTDESRIGLATFYASQMWFIAQAMSFLSAVVYFIINNGPFKHCLTGMGSRALQLHAVRSSPGHSMNGKSCRCWIGAFPKGTSELQLNPPWVRHRDLSTSPGFQPEATLLHPLPSLFEQQSHRTGSRKQIWDFSWGVKTLAISSETCPEWWQLRSIAPEFPQRHSRQGGKKSWNANLCLKLY